MPIPFETVQRDMRDIFYARARWQFKRCWMPVRCDISGKILWLVKAYRGEVAWHGPSDAMLETRWLGKFEFMKFRLTGKAS